MKRPIGVTIVGYLFIASGVGAILNVCLGILFRHHLYLNLSVLDVLIGGWLLNMTERGYRWGTLMIGFDMIMLPIGFVISLIGSEPGTFKLMGFPVGNVPRPVCAAIMVCLFIAQYWQWRVLREANRQGLFVTSAPSIDEPISA